MVIETTMLTIRPGMRELFEQNFEEAKEILAAASGFYSAELARGIERPSSYLLLVRWETLESHTEGFRGSELSLRLRALIGPFIDEQTPPTMEHHEPISHW